MLRVLLEVEVVVLGEGGVDGGVRYQDGRLRGVFWLYFYVISQRTILFSFFLSLRDDDDDDDGDGGAGGGFGDSRSF